MIYQVYTVEYEHEIKCVMILDDALEEEDKNPESFFVPGYKSYGDSGYVIVDGPGENSLDDVMVSGS